MKHLLLPILLLVACGSPEREPPTGPWRDVDESRAAALQTALEDARAEQDLTGLAMAVAWRDTRERWVSATGLADVAADEAWLPTDQSRIGSVTKTFTTALVLQLVEEGVVALEDPIETWVSGYWEGPTLEQLLGNTSGIVSYNYVGGFDTTRPWTPMELVQWAWDHEPALRFEPGNEWEYSNTNFVLLGLVVEAATGMSYEDALRTRLFEPEELTSTRLALTGDSHPDLVRCYEGEPPVDTSDTADPSFGWAAGAIVSTPADLVHWAVSLYGTDDVLGSEVRTRMVTPGTATTSDQEKYGLGTFYESDGEYTMYGHTGGIAGYLSYAYYLEDPAVAVVIFSNEWGTDLRAASMHPWTVVLGL